MAKNGCIKNNQKIVTKNKWPEIVKTIVILTWGCQNDSNFEKEHFLSIWGYGMSRKNDPKSKNDEEFFQQKGPFLVTKIGHY